MLYRQAMNLVIPVAVLIAAFQGALFRQVELGLYAVRMSVAACLLLGVSFFFAAIWSDSATWLRLIQMGSCVGAAVWLASATGLI